MARRSAAETAAAVAAAGHNLPKLAEYNSIFDRLHEVNDRMDNDRATHMGDMNAIYEEGAKALDMPKEIVAALYKQDRKERKAASKFAKADQRTRESFTKVADAYGADSPLGQWARRMANASQATASAAIAEDKDEE